MNYGVLLQWHTERGHLRWCTSMAEKSYPTSEVRGRSQEDTMPEGQWPRGGTPRPRSGAAAGRSYPTPLSPRPRVAVGRSNHTSKELWLRRRRRA